MISVSPAICKSKASANSEMLIPSVGDIVVALDEDSQNTLKTFDGIDEESGYAILKYENRRKYRNKVIRVRELVVQGVAKHVIKAL